jgi:hypothetical protein
LRILAHRQGPTILITRNGYDFSDRFLLIVDAVAALQLLADSSFVVDRANGRPSAAMWLARYQYSSANMMVMTRSVTDGSVGSGE